MNKFRFINDGRLSLFGIFCLVIFGFLLAYLSIEFVAWRPGKFIGMCLGLTLAAVGGFSGRANALGLPPAFSRDPLKWREAKKSYEGDFLPKKLEKNSHEKE